MVIVGCAGLIGRRYKGERAIDPLPPKTMFGSGTKP